MDPRELPPDAKLYLAADLYRLGSNDLAESSAAGLLSSLEALSEHAAAREYFERSQAFDAAVGRAFGEVPVPAGSLERVLAIVAEAEYAEPKAMAQPMRQSTGSAAPTPVELPASGRGAPVETGPALSRRGWLAACGASAAATAASVGFFFWWQGRQRPTFTLDDVLNQALAFHKSADSAQEPAVPISQSAPPVEYPLSPAIAGLRAVPRWRRLGGQLLGRPGVAYELAAENEPRAVMYVMAGEGRGRAPLIPALPTEPVHSPVTTGGVAVGAWREAERIVVFVAEGEAARYRSFLTSPREIA